MTDNINWYDNMQSCLFQGFPALANYSDSPQELGWSYTKTKTSLPGAEFTQQTCHL